MLSHMADPEKFAKNALNMEDAGAHCVDVNDSGGRLTMSDVRDRVQANRAVLRPETEIGIHAHHNLGLAVANSVVAVEYGAHHVEASLAGLGADVGNCPLEAFIAVADLTGWDHGCDLFALMDADDDIVRPLITRPVQVDRETWRWATPASTRASCCTRSASAPATASPLATSLSRRGGAKMVGGQEDLLADVALDLIAARG